MFGEKSVMGAEKCFSCNDFYLYLESLLKQSLQQERRCVANNYSWLSSREIYGNAVERYLWDLRPFINKMSSESCAAIAVKLDRITDEHSFTTSILLARIKKLLLEQDNIQIMEKSVKRGKERRRLNKVHPELNGRKAIVCFVVESDML